jgi:predicted transcriptional regulator
MARTCSLSVKVSSKTASLLDDFARSLRAVGDYSKSKIVEDALLDYFDKHKGLKAEIDKRMKDLRP